MLEKQGGPVRPLLREDRLERNPAGMQAEAVPASVVTPG